MNNPMLTVHEPNLSSAWAKAFLAASAPGVSALAPLVVVIDLNGGPIKEYPAVRCEVDAFLKLHSKHSCAETASTIFPKTLWNPHASRHQLYSRYLNILPRLKKVPANHYGIYFERLVSYGGTKSNQLEHLISTYLGGNHRASALLASVFDPSRDHTNQKQRGFPCLHQVTFTPLNAGELGVTGFYATQYLIDRAYGNYLGLANLGQFVAHEIGRQLTRVTCVASRATIGDFSKEEARPLAEHLQLLISAAEAEEQS